jgi:hypothetical protein
VYIPIGGASGTASAEVYPTTLIVSGSIIVLLFVLLAVFELLGATDVCTPHTHQVLWKPLLTRM